MFEPMWVNYLCGIITLALLFYGFIHYNAYCIEKRERRYLEKVAEDNKEFLIHVFKVEFKKAAQVNFYNYNVALPAYNYIKLPDARTLENMRVTVEDLFEYLGVKEQLSEVYEIEEENGVKSYTGKFAKDGQKRFAEIIDKELVFFLSEKGQEHSLGTNDQAAFFPK